MLRGSTNRHAGTEECSPSRAFLLGVADGFANPYHLSTGLVWPTSQAPTQAYKDGVNAGQALARHRMGKKVLVCPNCGATEIETPFAYYEDVLAVRRVVGFSDDGVLEICGQSNYCDDSGGDTPRLSCGKCRFEFGIPDNVEYDWT